MLRWAQKVRTRRCQYYFHLLPKSLLFVFVCASAKLMSLASFKGNTMGSLQSHNQSRCRIKQIGLMVSKPE